VLVIGGGSVVAVFGLYYGGEAAMTYIGGKMIVRGAEKLLRNAVRPFVPAL
jgi:hypothetical protein